MKKESINEALDIARQQQEHYARLRDDAYRQGKLAGLQLALWCIQELTEFKEAIEGEIKELL